MTKDNDWFFNQFDHDTFNRDARRLFKGFGCLWLVGAFLSFLVSIAVIIGVVVVILHFA